MGVRLPPSPKTFLNFSLDVLAVLCIMYLISVMLIVLQNFCVVMVVGKGDSQDTIGGEVGLGPHLP